MSQLFVLALVVGTVSFTVSRAKIFEPVREAAAARSLFLARLLGCTYCTSHWVAALVALVYQPRTGVSEVAVLDLVAAGFGLVAMSAPVAGLIAFSYGLIGPAAEEPVDEHAQEGDLLTESDDEATSVTARALDPSRS